MLDGIVLPAQFCEKLINYEWVSELRKGVLDSIGVNIITILSFLNEGKGAISPASQMGFYRLQFGKEKLIKAFIML